MEACPACPQGNKPKHLVITWQLREHIYIYISGFDIAKHVVFKSFVTSQGVNLYHFGGFMCLRLHDTCVECVPEACI